MYLDINVYYTIVYVYISTKENILHYFYIMYYHIVFRISLTYQNMIANIENKDYIQYIDFSIYKYIYKYIQYIY